MASYYPRYYGYYEKAIGIYTHVSDQYAVLSTQVISCSPREALYVLDGLLENNTILKIREHTTDTHKINDIVESLRQQGEAIEDETLSHISLLPFRHVVPNGTYFIEDF